MIHRYQVRVRHISNKVTFSPLVNFIALLIFVIKFCYIYSFATGGDIIRTDSVRCLLITSPVLINLFNMTRNLMENKLQFSRS